MLAKTHRQLEGHFRELSRERAALGYPVYAFEHGLEPDELELIRRALRSELAGSGNLNREHWLLWTVLAAEVGYTYDGDEYWDSFASGIPEWRSYGSRDTIRDWFKNFAQHYAGFQPSGRWADHFSIIAWPITHSILPRYLQSHFARHLYELSYDLSAKDNSSTDRIGRILEQRYHGGSSRFENFLQQTALTARLVLALRDEDVQGAVSPIYRPTLARITRDLERKGSSRGYLHDARRILRDARLQVRGGPSGYPSAQSTSPMGEDKALPTGIKLIGRHGQDDSWTLGIALPDFPALLAQTGVAAALLDKTRMRFADRPDGWMPGRALLSYSGSDHALGALPNLDEPMVQFKDPVGLVTALSSHLKMLSRSPWLLRVHQDGIARQVLGNHVRTGESYLIVTGEPISSDTAPVLGLSEAPCRTSGVFLYRLETPNAASMLFIQALSKLGFGYALRARVEPVGLVPRWDVSLGGSVWLPTEEILLRLTAEFAVAEFSLTVGGTKTRISVQDGREVIVSLGTLPLGRHVVEIGATAAGVEPGTKGLRAVSPEVIFLEVRSPIPWQKGIQRQAGLRIVLEPIGASLDDLLGKRASLSVHGPADRTALIEVRLYDMAGHLAESAEIGRLDLPSKDTAMARAIERLANEPLSEKIQSAPRVELAFSVEELGVVTASFPHRVPPLRWKLAPEGIGFTMRLIDETGVAGDVLVNRYDMAIPDRRVDLAPSDCLRGVLVDAPGALFVARFDGRFYSAFASVPPRERLTAFTDLAVNITLAAPGDSARKIVRLLTILRLWRAARPLGSLATLRKTSVLGVIERQIERLACGSRWADRAQRYRSGNIAGIEELQGDVGGSPGFASRMRTTEWTWHSDKARARAEFLRLATTYGVSHDPSLCDLALRLAFQPAAVRVKDKSEAESFVQLGTAGILARGAFFAKLTSDLRFRDPEIQPADAR
jgi:hypothetical protein